MIDILSIAFGLAGFLFGAKCYRELWKWARQCQNARIAIAHKKRVQLNAPLTEWLTWANALTKGDERGRVIYRNAHVSVAIIRKPHASHVRSTIGRVRGALRHRKGPVDPPVNPADVQPAPRYGPGGDRQPKVPGRL